MDSYFPKTRRPIGPLSLKRPLPAASTPAPEQPKTPPKQQQQARTRPLQPPPAPKKLCRPSTKLRRLAKTPLFNLDDDDDNNNDDAPQTTTKSSANERAPTEIRVEPLRIPSEEDKTTTTPPPPAPEPEAVETRRKEKEVAASGNASKSLKTIISRRSETDKPKEVAGGSTKITNGPLKGVSTSLLDIIRAKEAAAKAISPEEERKRELLGIAPEVVRIVPTVFTSSKREILPYNKVVEKCHKGLKSNYTTTTIIECLDLMEKVVPDWISTVTISRGKFMRINRQNHTIPHLLGTIKLYKQKLTTNNSFI